MKRYRVIYTIATEVEAESEYDALNIASEMGYDEFSFIDEEAEELEEVE